MAHRINAKFAELSWNNLCRKNFLNIKTSWLHNNGARVCIFSTHAGAFGMQRSNFLGLFVSTRGSESTMADKYVSRMNQGLARAYILGGPRRGYRDYDSRADCCASPVRWCPRLNYVICTSALQSLVIAASCLIECEFKICIRLRKD